MVFSACGPTSRGTRIGEAVVLPRSVHCSIDILGQKDPVNREHRVIGNVEVWGVSASDGTALQRQVQLRACELGADAVINLAARGGDAWSGQAVVWLSEANAPPPEPKYVPRPPQPVEEPPPPPPPEEVAPVETVEEPEEDEPPAKGKRKRKGKRKGKRKRRR